MLACALARKSRDRRPYSRCAPAAALTCVGLTDFEPSAGSPACTIAGDLASCWALVARAATQVAHIPTKYLKLFCIRGNPIAIFYIQAGHLPVCGTLVTSRAHFHTCNLVQSRVVRLGRVCHGVSHGLHWTESSAGAAHSSRGSSCRTWSLNCCRWSRRCFRT